MAGLAFAFNGAPIFYGILRGQLIPMLILFAVFGVINFFLDKYDKKNHAEISEDGDEYKDLAACWIVSNALLIASLELAIYSGVVLPLWQSAALGIVTCVLAIVSISNLFYNRRTLDDDYKDLRRRIKNMTKPEVTAVLSENLPEFEHKAVYFCDWEGKDINFVADVILKCSPRTVSRYRQAGYEKLRRLYEK